MSNLQNQSPADTYKGLLQVNDYTNGVNATAKYIQDGEGTNSALSLSTTKVGVGTASPDSKLEIVDSSNHLNLKVADTVSQSVIRFSDSNGLAGAINYDHNTDKLHFITDGTAIPTNGALNIDSDGNCGIGTTSPVTKLDINEVAGNLDVIQSFSKGGVGQARVGLCGTTSQVLQGALADDLCIRSDGHNIRFGTASATRTDMTIDSDGRVGIGTTSPSAKLDISTNNTTGLRLINPDSAAANQSNDPPAILFQASGWDTDVGSRAYSARIRVNSNYSGASDRGNTHPVMNFDLETNEDNPDDSLSTKMVINADGQVGIGTTSPSAKLEVSTASENTGGAYGNLTDSLLLTNKSDSAGAGPKLIFYNNPDTGSGTPSALIGLQRKTDAITAGSNEGNLVFLTRGTTNPEERMRIDSDGNCGIGTTSPSAKLDISTTGLDGLRLSVDSQSYYHMIRPNGDSLYIGADEDDSGASGADIRLNVKGDEKMRITSDGNVGVGVTNPSSAFEVQCNSDEAILKGISPNGLSNFFIKKTNAGDTEFSNSFVSGGAIRDFIFSNGDVTPSINDAQDVGSATKRWDDIYATNQTIQTSDRELKQDIEELTEAEQRVAVACKGLLRKYRWKSSVEEKGDGARIHFGIMAQDLEAAFTAEGLDVGRYGMFIKNTWWEADRVIPAVEAVEAAEAVYDEEGNEVSPAVEAVEAQPEKTERDIFNNIEEAPEGANEVTQRGVRYGELLAFIIAAI